ncbi:NAD(P)-dependent glycerol-3-phosphate dehydrogenase [Candidatus Nomurabacteria bacterium]|nr:NAD(P)-dependent glycerol-3-phosphate dehydrogenase [Candidatus Nomurabacteria bacterium]
MSDVTKEFWKRSQIAVLGGGNWGTVLAQLVSQNCECVRFWVSKEQNARTINSTRMNSQYHPELVLNSNIQAYCEITKVFESGVHAVIWALPSSVTRDVAKTLAPFFHGSEVLLHATKGVEAGSLKRISQILREEISCPRVGVISGPNLAPEIAKGEPAATVVASFFDEVITAGQMLLSTDKFRVYGAKDIVGVEWAGSLKNILAIASGALDTLNLGWNARAMLLARGLAEMVRFGVQMGAESSTFLGLAGMGDLLATSQSVLSRNYRVGQGLARGKPLNNILEDLGSTAEGVVTAKHIWEFANRHEIYMPITEAVYQLLYEKREMKEILQELMNRPPMWESKF